MNIENTSLEIEHQWFLGYFAVLNVKNCHDNPGGGVYHSEKAYEVLGISKILRFFSIFQKLLDFKGTFSMSLKGLWGFSILRFWGFFL